MAPPGPLSGINVLDLKLGRGGTDSLGRVFADYGATVIHVETSRRVGNGPARSAPHHGGGGRAGAVRLVRQHERREAGHRPWILSYEEARDVVRELTGWADLVTESRSTAGRDEGLGAWTYESLRVIKPDLVMLSTSLLGQTGPYSTVSGYGNQRAPRWPDISTLPAGPTAHRPDQFGPYTSTIQRPDSPSRLSWPALDHRRRTGEGTYIDQAQAESAMHFLAPAFVDFSATGKRGRADGE